MPYSKPVSVFNEARDRAGCFRFSFLSPFFSLLLFFLLPSWIEQDMNILFIVTAIVFHNGVLVTRLLQEIEPG